MTYLPQLLCVSYFSNAMSTHFPPIEDISISFKHERHKALCGSLVDFIHLNLATQHCWNEHFLPVLPIFNPNHTKYGVHTGAAITSDGTKSLIVRNRYPGPYISRNVQTCRQSRFYGEKNINIIKFSRIDL